MVVAATGTAKKGLLDRSVTVAYPSVFLLP